MGGCQVKYPGEVEYIEKVIVNAINEGAPHL